MRHALTASAITFALWGFVTLMSIVGVGAAIGALTARLIPPGQRRLPRSLWMLACLWASTTVGALAGLHVGAAQATLAAGDSLAAGTSRIGWLWSRETRAADAVAAAQRLPAYVHDETRHVLEDGVLRLVVVHFVLGAVYEPLVGLGTLAKAYRAQSGPYFTALRARASWQAARPALAEVRARKIMATLVAAALHLLALLVVGLAILAFSRAELRRAPRGP